MALAYPEARASTKEKEHAIPRLEYYFGADCIFEALHSNDVALVKSLWIVEASKTKGNVLAMRQQLPADAFWKCKEIFTPSGSFFRTVVSISHAWLTYEHPDPEGRNLQTIARCLTFLSEKYGDMAIYWDWCSLYQAPRSQEEQTSFKRALSDAHVWWMSSHTFKLLLTVEPEGSEALPYLDRGWPNFEREISYMNTATDLILDLRHFDPACQDYKSTIDICVVKRPPPITPKSLGVRLEKKRWSVESDCVIAQRLYQECFMSWISGVKDLNFAGHSYHDEEISFLAGAIRHCGRLQHLDLSANHITNEGAKRLAAAVPRCRRLVHLELQGNPIGNLGVAVLQKSWSHVRKPEEGLIVVSIDSVEKEDRDGSKTDDQQQTEEQQMGLTSSIRSSSDGPDFFYQGMYKNNQRHGEGTLSNRITGFKYVGKFVGDLFEGHGDATWQDGSTYSGEWLKGQKSGKGVFTSGHKPNQVKYVGEWANGQRVGHGMQEYEDGGKYTGSWVNGVCGGKGTYVFANGNRYVGTWQNGRYDGPGVLHNQDGTTERLQYHAGLLMSRAVLQTESLPVMYTRAGEPIVLSLGKATLRQRREDVHKPTQLPPLNTSKKLITRPTCDGYDLSAPPLRQLSARAPASIPLVYSSSEYPMTAR